MTTSNRALPLYNGDQDYKCTHILFSQICNKPHNESCKLSRAASIFIHTDQIDPPIPNPTPQGCVSDASPYPRVHPTVVKINDSELLPFPALTGVDRKAIWNWQQNTTFSPGRYSLPWLRYKLKQTKKWQEASHISHPVSWTKSWRYFLRPTPFSRHSPLHNLVRGHHVP